MHATQRTMFSILSGLTAGLAAFWYIVPEGILNASVWASLCSYLALSFCYWAFINLNLTSLRIRLVRELLKEKGYALSTDKIMQRYSPQELVDRRIERLEKSNQIKRSGDKWILLSKKLMFIILTITVLRKLIMPQKIS
jgi:hypothetical protein